MKRISITKAKHIFCQVVRHFLIVKKKLPQYQQDEFKKAALEFDVALKKRDRKLLKQKTQLLKNKQHRILPKITFRKCVEWTLGLVVAFFVAFTIRQTWLELYTIPTGSMRPTLLEQDKMLVSKSKFGINYPFINGHFYFNSELVKRLQVVILSGNNLDILDPWTRFLGVLPVKKQFIKRLVAKPNDQLYFYGGKIYGMDDKGGVIEDYASPLLKDIDYIPYISMLGKSRLVANRTYGPEYTYSQFGMPLIKAFVTKNNFVATEVFNGEKWQLNTGMTTMNEKGFQYRDLFGMKHFAKTRLITEREKKLLYPEETLQSPTDFFVEIFSLPNLTQEAWDIRLDPTGVKIITLKPIISLLPLEEKHLDRIMEHIYTARFIVQNNKAYNYDHFSTFPSIDPKFLPNFVGVEDGTYEFLDGVLYRIDYFGNRKQIDKTHPLYSKSIANVQNLFNFGIGFYQYFSPEYGNDYVPNRVAYYNMGDLYLLGHKVFDQSDKVLVEFVEAQKKRQQNVSAFSSFAPFIDEGPPLKDGKLDKSLIRKFGLKIPQDYYLMLGDNHAMSADSRDFGFVPQDNIMGTPMFKFWPLQDFGAIHQASSKHLTFSNIFMWLIVLVCLILYKLYKNWRYRHFIKKIK
ncbi:MAG: Signal peptidase IB [Chlamydiae bacterium]|nr:Signal peptidase IB [Chlamydiota bacterium]